MTSQPAPEVSVITPAWQSVRFIETAIASVQAQRDVDWEMIIVDDASLDKTGDLVQAIAKKDARIIYDRLSQNSGPSGARNRAIELARAPFIAVLDDDDTMHPDRLRTMLDAAEKYRADIVVDNMLRIADTPDGRVLQPFLKLPDSAEPQRLVLKDYIDPATEDALGEGLGYLKPLIRLAALRKHGTAYDMRLRNSEDFYLIVEMLALKARMILLPQALYNYTIRQGSLSYRLSAPRAKAILDAEERFRARFARTFDMETAAASRDQLRQRKDAYAFAALVEVLKAGRADKAIGVMVREPRSVPHMAGELLRIAREKLSI